MAQFSRYGEDDPRSFERYQWIYDYLQPGETVLCRTKPSLRHTISKEDFVISMIALFFAILLCSDTNFSSLRRIPLPVYPLLLLFVGGFLYVILGRLLIKFFRLLFTEYVITSSRLLCKQFSTVSFRNYTPETGWHVRAHRDGCGSIYTRMTSRNSTLLPYPLGMTCLEEVPEAEEICNLLKERQGM